MKTKRSLLKICLLGAMLLLPAVAQAQFIFTTDNGAITITGYSGDSSASLTIPAAINGFPVTGIGAGAFYDQTTLTSVSIPDSVTSIGSGAFYYCQNLASVNIPASVTNIGSAAFSYCGLTSIAIPSSIANIPDQAFYYCGSLTNVISARNLSGLPAERKHKIV